MNKGRSGIDKQIAILNLRENRRKYQRYKLTGTGTFWIEHRNFQTSPDRCELVNLSSGGICVKMKNVKFQVGTVLRLQFFTGMHNIDFAGKVVHITKEDGEYLVGIQSLRTPYDILKQFQD